MRQGAQVLARLLLLAALSLPALIFMPHAQHAFWTPEAFAASLLAPLAALAAFSLRQGGAAAAPGPSSGPGAKSSGTSLDGLDFGLALLLLLIGLWFFSAGLAFRKDLAARELARWTAAPLIFFASFRLGQTPRERARLLALIFCVGALESLYALIQSSQLEQGFVSVLGGLARRLGIPTFGFDSLLWVSTFGGRAGAFFGNPNFLGGHLALLLPLALAWAMDDRISKRVEALRWALAGLLLAGLLATQTRGAWIGAALGVGFTLYLCRKQMPGILTRNRIPLWGLGFLGLAAATLILAFNRGSLLRLATQGGEELSKRVVLMKAALKMAGQHPLFGVGPGNYRIYFPQVQLTGLKPEEYSSRPYVYSEHTHNDFLQMAADCGFPAALIWAALIAWVFARLLKGLGQGSRLKAEREEGEGKHVLFLSGALGGFVALTIHSLANFPFLIAPTQMTAWALAALALASITNEPALSPSTSSEQAQAGETGRVEWLGGGWARIGIALAAFSLWGFGAWHAGREMYKDALWWVGQGESSLSRHHEGKEILFRALEIDRKDDRLWYLHGLATVDEGFVLNAVGSFKQALDLNPHNMEARLRLGLAYAQTQKWPEAEEALKPVAKDAPNLSDAWEPLAASLYMQSKYEEAVRAYDWALLYKPANATQLMDNKAASLGNLGRYQEAIQTLRASEQIDPKRAKTYINKAITYIKMGVKPMARISLQSAKELDPKNPEIKNIEKVLH